MTAAGRRNRLGLVLLVAGGVAVLEAAVVPGVFTIDEDNYLASTLALRHGGFHLPDTAGLPWSPELFFFEPNVGARVGRQTPVASLAPPLYGPLSLPFSLLGWRGLFTLNIAAFVLCAGLVFTFVRRAPWGTPARAGLGAAAFLVGGPCLDYALGVWPHMLSVCLTFAAFVLAHRARTEGRPGVAFAAGVLAATAVGIRYPNLAYAVAVAVSLLLARQRRWALFGAFALGAALPMLASTLINVMRDAETLVPVSKGLGYLKPGLAMPAEEVGRAPGLGGALGDGLLSVVARLVDFSVMPWNEIYGRMGFHHDPRTGAFIGLTAVRKALLQSAPWVVALAVLAATPNAAPADRAEARREGVALLLPVLGLLGVFFLAGSARHEGACSTERYLLDVVPLAAVALARVVPITPTPTPWAAGALGGGVLAAATLFLAPDDVLRHRLLLRAPLVLGAALLVTGLGPLRRRPTLAVLAVGASLAWGAVVHVGDDLAATRRVRAGNAAAMELVAAALDERPAALFAAHPAAFGPLKLDHDLVLLTLNVDQAQDSPRMADALMAHGRRLLFFEPLTPPGGRTALLGGRAVRRVGGPGWPLLEILPAGGGAR